MPPVTAFATDEVVAVVFFAVVAVDFAFDAVVVTGDFAPAGAAVVTVVGDDAACSLGTVVATASVVDVTF
jgi:hypothetical protein